MKLYVTLLQLVALLSLAGSTPGDDVTPTGCTVTPDRDQGMHVKMNELAVRCLGIDGATVAAIDNLEGRETYFKNRCDKKQQVLECLAGVSLTSQVCDTEIGHKFFLIYRDLLETVLDRGCVQDGELVANMTMMFNASQTPAFKRDHFHDCVHTAVDRIVRCLLDQDIGPHSRFFIIYRELVNSKECFGDIDEGDVTLMKAIESLLGDVVDRMKCMHPQEETAVLCKAIDVNLPDVPRVCPMKSLHEVKHPLKETLLEGMSWCVSSTFLDEESLNSIDSLETSWEFFVYNCKKKDTIRKCLSEVVTLSSVCLNEGQHNAVKLADDLLQRGLDYLCIVDSGYPAGYVVHKALNKTGATVGHNDISECITLAHTQEDESEIHIDAADFLIFYQELKVFKGCLINKMHGDNRAVFDVHLFLSSLQRSMKCLDPEHGTLVLCETIDTEASTEVKVCPFVLKHENEPRKYERFIDFVILCTKAAAVELDPIKMYTSLEQFQTFFKSFCHKRHDVKHCLDDVTSMSAVCLSQPDHRMLTTYTDAYGSALESGCKQDGEIFATILNGMWVDAEHGIVFDLLQTCVNTTSDQYNNHVSDTASKTSVYHYELYASLTRCILNDASQVGTFKTVFATFTNELLRDFKCIHPDDGTLVLCESVVNSR